MLTQIHGFTLEGRAFAGAEFLKNVVQKAVPEPERLLATTSNGADMASHILSSLYEQLDEICLLEDGEVQKLPTERIRPFFHC